MTVRAPVSPLPASVSGFGDVVVAIVLRHLPGTELIYVFGSAAAATMRPDSDLDLAVLTSDVLGSETRRALADALADAVGADVDLVNLADASTVLRKEVVANGALLFERGPCSRAAFEGRVLADYARLNEERAPVLERIAREGSIFEAPRGEAPRP